jgi:hypothetical protein
MFVVCGKANFTNLSRYSDYSERTYRRQYRKEVDFIQLHGATIGLAIESSREQIASIDCSFVSKSGKETWGLAQFYNGSAGKAEKGLEVSVIAVVDVAAHQGYTLSVQQTKGKPKPSETSENSEATGNSIEAQVSIPSKGKKKRGGKPTEATISERVQGYQEQLKQARPHLPIAVKYLAADSFYSKKSIVDEVLQLDLHLVSKLRIDADLRYLYTGPQKPRGAPRKYGDKVNLFDLSTLNWVCQLPSGEQLYTQVVWHVSLKRQIRIVYLLDLTNPDKPRAALLFSTDTEIDPQQLHLYYKSRFQIEFVFRDAKQFSGLCDSQTRHQGSLDFHFNVSLAALNLAKLDLQRAQDPTASPLSPSSFSIDTYKRLALNRHLLDRFISMLGLDPTSIKSHPNYRKLLHYGSLTA